MDFQSMLQAQWPEWRLMETIGRTAYSTVFRAEKNKQAGSEAAIRAVVISGRNEQADAAVNRYVQAIRAQMRLGACPYLLLPEDVTVWQDPEGRGSVIFVRTALLPSLISQWGRLPHGESEMRRLLRDITAGLSYCHENRLFHGAISPERIFMGRWGEYRLGGFPVRDSLGEVIPDPADKRSLAAPEQSALRPNDAEALQKANVFLWGMTAYQIMNNGFLPPEAGILMHPQPDQRPRDLRNCILPRPMLASDALAALLRPACAFRPGDRYAGAGAMLRAMQDAAMRERPAAPMPPVQPVPQPEKEPARPEAPAPSVPAVPAPQPSEEDIPALPHDSTEADAPAVSAPMECPPMDAPCGQSVPDEPAPEPDIPAEDTSLPEQESAAPDAGDDGQDPVTPAPPPAMPAEPLASFQARPVDEWPEIDDLDKTIK